MEPAYYRLNDQNLPVPISRDEWFADSGHQNLVAKDDVGDVNVSTVFLGLDHNVSIRGAPILWETMVFGGPLDQEMERYTSADAARVGHERWIQRVKDAERRR
jgi:hypothetical protein